MADFAVLRDHLIDAQKPLSAVLREAYVLARQLNEPKFLDWVQLELRGYPDVPIRDSRVPDYRRISGRLFTQNLYRGDYVQVSLGDDALTETVCRTPVWESVPRIESYISGVARPDQFLAIPLTHAQTALLQQFFQTELHPVLRFEVSDYRSILDAVRDRLLEFTMDLEQDMPGLDPRNATGGDRARVGDMFERAVFHAPVVMTFAQSTSGSITQAATPMADTNEIRHLVDELRRSLKNWPAPDETKEGASICQPATSAINIQGAPLRGANRPRVETSTTEARNAHGSLEAS